jgi:hypothetical protein
MLHLFRTAMLGGRSGAPWRIPACAIVLAAAAPALQAQTIVPNPHLNTALTPWNAFASTAPDPVGAGEAPVWQSPPDVDNSPTSGSARVRMTPSATNAASGISQCFDFSSPTSVAFLNYGMALRVPAVVALDGSMSANVEIRLYSGAGCSGFLGGGSQGQVLNNAMSGDTWYRIRDNNFVPNDAPVTAASAEVRGYLRQTGAAATQSDYAINFDHFVLVLNSTTPVELIRYEVD